MSDSDTPTIRPLRRPFTLQEIKDFTSKDPDRYLTAVVAVDFDDLVDNDIEWLNDTVSELITGDEIALEDIGFKPVGAMDGEIYIEVTGSILHWLQEQEAE
jgi:hypothetical protein